MSTVSNLPSPIAVVFDIDGVVRDVAGSYRRAVADTVEQFTNGQYRPPMTDIDALKAEGCWNNDWDASQELIYRYYEGQQQPRSQVQVDYQDLVKFFQSRYFGTDFSGYIQNEPLLMSKAYLERLTQTGVGWGFFSGATRRSALYVLSDRLKLHNPVLVAMEDAPGKPDPTGLMAAVRQLNGPLTVFYVGDTVADIQTAVKAQAAYPEIDWVGVGVLPPHAHGQVSYQERLEAAGAIAVLNRVEDLTPALLRQWVTDNPHPPGA